MKGIIGILVLVWFLRLLFSPDKKAAERRDDHEQEYYKDLYRDYYGKDPDHRITRWEMAELDELEDEEYEDDQHP